MCRGQTGLWLKLGYRGGGSRRQETNFCIAWMHHFRDFFASATHLSRKDKSVSCSSRLSQDWSITHTPNHWSNEDTMLEYIEKVFLPYVCKKRKELNLPPNHPAPAMFDVFKGQCTEAVQSLLEKNNIHVVSEPNTTNRLQPSQPSQPRTSSGQDQ